MRSRRGGEDVGRAVVGDVAVGPGDPQLAVALEQPLEVNEGHLDHVPVLIELDTVPLGTGVCVWGRRVSVIARHTEVKHVPAIVVVMLLEVGISESDGGHGFGRGSLSWSTAVMTQPGLSLKSTTTRSHRFGVRKFTR